VTLLCVILGVNNPVDTRKHKYARCPDAKKQGLIGACENLARTVLDGCLAVLTLRTSKALPTKRASVSSPSAFAPLVFIMTPEN
jgi:hypothetical protein